MRTSMPQEYAAASFAPLRINSGSVKTQGLATLNTDYDVPVVYGLLTCNNMEQAEDRCGGMLGNKGDECAVTAIKMADYRRSFGNQ